MLVMSDIFEWITEWYLSHCDGDWEHQRGIKIDTLDNPGWSVVIDLIDTELQGMKASTIYRNLDDGNSLH